MSIKFTSAKAFAVAMTATLLPVAAQAAEPNTFTAEGVSYRYTTSVINGRTVITGQASDGKTFRLTVGDSIVTGQFGGKQVRFQRAAARDALVAVR